MKLLICTQAINKNHPILGFFHSWTLEFSKHAEEIHIICLEKGEYGFPPHVHVHSLGKEAGASKLLQLVRFYYHFARVFFSVRPTYVFFHMGAIYNVLAAPFFIIRRLFGIQFYWWKAHGHINWFGRLASWFVDRIYTSTESGYPINTHKRHVVGQAIDTTQFYTAGARKQASNPQVLFVGRIMSVKHLETFIDVAAQFPKLTFTITGPTPDTAYAQLLNARAAAVSNVALTGAKTQAELPALYQAADIFLNTSLTHSMDKTVLEAILCGCVPVTANLAFRALLEPHGLFVESPTVMAYSAVLKRVLESDREPLVAALQVKVKAEHALDTFFSRIFHD